MPGQTTARLPRDPESVQHGAPVQVLQVGLVLNAAMTGVSARIGPFPAWSIIRVWCDADCYFLPGDGAVVAAAGTSVPLTAFQAEFYFMGPNTHIAFILQAGAGPKLFSGVQLL